MLAWFFFSLFLDLNFLSVNNPVILIEQALSIKDLLFRELFRFILKELRIKNDFFYLEGHVCSTINPRESLMFSMFCLSPADLCDSTAG